MSDDMPSQPDARATCQAVDPRTERSRAAVVEAAATLLFDEGPDAITHARVAAAANVSRTTVYRYYPERHDLMRATIEGIGQPVPSSGELVGDLRTDLRMLLGVLADDLREDSHCTLMLTMLARSRHDPVVDQVRGEMMDQLEQAFGELFGTAIERGELRADLDIARSQASLAGSLIYTSLVANRDVDEQFVTALIDDFLVRHAAD